MSVKAVGVKNLSLDAISDNPYSANEEDRATFDRLKDELKANGLLELPVVFHDKKSDAYRYIAGHHRSRAWRELKHEDIDCIVIEGSLTPEEEFNLVNNLNQVRGELTLTRVKRIVRQFAFDVTKLDLFKMPVTRLLPSEKMAPESETDLQRKGKIRDMALQIAGEVAQSILEDETSVVVAFRVDTKLVAVINCPMAAQDVRANVSVFKGIIDQTVTEWLDNGRVSRNSSQ